MKEKTIRIAGKEYQIVFNLQTILNFEEMANISFFGEDFHRFIHKIYLVASAIYAANDKADIKAEDMMKVDVNGVYDIIEAYNQTMQMANEFFKVPEVAKPEEPEPEKTEGDEKPKN